MKAKLSLALAILHACACFALPERAPQSPVDANTRSLAASHTNGEPIPFESCDEDEACRSAMLDYSASDSLHLLQRRAAERRDHAVAPVKIFERLRSLVQKSVEDTYGIVPWLLVALLLGMICCCPSILRPDPPIDKALMQKVSAAQQYAESPEVLWLNTLISVLWPKINVYVQNVMVSIVQPAINHALPRLLRGTITFGKITLGDARPNIGSIVVRKREADTVVVDVGLNVDLDIVFTVRAAGVASLTVKRIVLSGKVSVVFRPLQTEPPFFGGLEIYFANAPEVGVHFGGLAQAAHFPGLRGIVRSALMSTITRFLVLPSRIGIPISESEDSVGLAELKFPDPPGILRLTLLRGDRIQANSDVHVIVKLGQDVWKSPSAKQSTSPAWTEENVTEHVVHDMTQVCTVLVYDENPKETEDLIGQAKDVPLDVFGGSLTGEVVLPLQRDGKRCGQIVFKSTWLQLGDSGLGNLICTRTNAPAVRKDSSQGSQSCLTGCCPLLGPRQRTGEVPATLLPGHSDLILFAKIVSVSGLPPNSKPPFTVHLIAGGLETTTHPSYPLRGGLSAGKMKEEIAWKLSQHGLLSEEIGKILDLWPEFVKNLVSAKAEANEGIGQEKLNDWRTSVQLKRAITDPQWYEILKLLMPLSDELLNEPITLVLRDSRGTVLGDSLKVNFTDITESEHAELEGPFQFSESIVMKASFRVRSLKALTMSASLAASAVIPRAAG